VTIIRLAHYAIRTADLEASRRFYTEVMGLRVGHRPPFPFPGLWLYQQEDQSTSAIVHIIGVGPDDPKSFEGYWGIGSSKPRSSTGSFEHIAFLVNDWPHMRTRCGVHRVDYVERSVPELGLHQVFLHDPSGVTLELNYPAVEGGGA
jgi:catechol 2,3-dioxygenase-like lactoylglutathione lyase family enzyme